MDASVDVGALGEAEFKRWCEICGLLATKADPDKMGWDFFVEILPKVLPLVPLDRQHSAHKALFQIKSTWRQQKSLNIKLSALKRLVDTDLPAFLLGLSYKNSTERPTAQLLHIGADEIEETLKKVREFEALGRRDINNQKISISLKNAITLDVKSDQLGQKIESFLSDDNYALKKAESRVACGYGSENIRGSLVFGGEISTSDIVDLMIGARGTLRLQQAKFETARFGITLKNDIISISDAEISVSAQPAAECRIVAQSKTKNLRAALAVKAFAPGIPGLDSRDFKMRFHNDWVELIVRLSEHSGGITFDFDSTKSYVLHELSDALRFFTTLTEDDADVKIEFKYIEPLIFNRLALPDRRWFKQFLLPYAIAERLSSACFYSRMMPAPCFTLREIWEIVRRHHDEIAILLRPGLVTKFQPIEGHRIPRKMKIIASVTVDLGTMAYVAIIVADAETTFSATSKLYTCRSHTPAVLEEFLTHAIDEDVISEKLEHHTRQISSKIPVICFEAGDLLAK